MKLNEIFDKPQPRQSDAYLDRHWGWNSTATLSDGSSLRIVFTPMFDVADDYYYLSFGRKKNDKDDMEDLVGYSHNKTGDGLEVEVMSTVVEAIKEFVGTYNPTGIIFAARVSDDKRPMSRTNLYTRMLNRYIGSEYEVTQDVQADDYLTSVKFTLVRKEQHETA